VLTESRLGPRCEECGEEFPNLKETRASKRFCSDRCRYRARDRKRYQADPDAQRERARAWYWANRERVLARMSAERRRRRPSA
jgi:hypothetical protein